MKKLILLLIIETLLYGCGDMDLNPLSEGSSESWYSNETEILQALNELYNIDYWEQYSLLSNGVTSSWTEAFPDSWSSDFLARNYVNFINGGTINPGNTIVNAVWQRSYKCIQAANQIIENISRAEGKVSEENINKFIADAKFVRASQYSKLIFLYGDVPFYTGLLSIDDAFSMGRTDKETILQTIYDDYDFAALHLPEVYGNNELKHATKGAALAMKARIALYMGDWNTAKNAAKECIDLGIYELFPDFTNYFYEKNATETVFGIARSIELGSYLTSNVIDKTKCRNCRGYSTVGPSWDLFCSFLCTDGLPIDESPLFDPHEPFKNRDPRCAATIVEFGSRHLGVTYQPHPDSLKTWDWINNKYITNNDSRGVTQYASYNGLVWKKWLDEGWWPNNQSDQDNIVIRFADVLLMYAEAKIELGEIDQSVLDAINQVRARAYGVDYNETVSYPTVTSMDKVKLRTTVRIERRMEFAFEGLRHADIIRWKLAEKVLNKPQYGMLDPSDLREKVVSPGLWFFPEIPSIDEDGVADFTSMYNQGLIKLLAIRSFDASKNYLWPIPAKEILINENITQNPGY